jgi:hypothetical protein
MAMSDAPEPAALGDRGRWLQLGMLSAAAAAPLIARWRSLRADDRAQALFERAEALRALASARLSDAGQAAQSLQQSLQRTFSRDGSGHAATDAAERLAASLAVAQAVEDEARRRRARRASFWLAGVSAGLIAAGAVTYIIIRNRALARAENDTLVELSLDHLSGGPPTAPAPGEPPITEAPPSREPGFAPPPAFTDEDGDGATWVGDIYTRVYMPMAGLDRAALPEHDRRIYFASEERAIAAGYHRAGADTPAAPAEPADAPAEGE